MNGELNISRDQKNLLAQKANAALKSAFAKVTKKLRDKRAAGQHMPSAAESQSSVTEQAGAASRNLELEFVERIVVGLLEGPERFWGTQKLGMDDQAALTARFGEMISEQVEVLQQSGDLDKIASGELTLNLETILEVMAEVLNEQDTLFEAIKSELQKEDSLRDLDSEGAALLERLEDNLKLLNLAGAELMTMNSFVYMEKEEQFKDGRWLTELEQAPGKEAHLLAIASNYGIEDDVMPLRGEALILSHAQENGFYIDDTALAEAKAKGKQARRSKAKEKPQEEKYIEQPKEQEGPQEDSLEKYLGGIAVEDRGDLRVVWSHVVGQKLKEVGKNAFDTHINSMLRANKELDVVVSSIDNILKALTQDEFMGILKDTKSAVLSSEVIEGVGEQDVDNIFVQYNEQSKQNFGNLSKLREVVGVMQLYSGEGAERFKNGEWREVLEESQNMDPVVLAMERQWQIAGMDPMAWAVKNKRQVGGMDPLLYALKNSVRIDNQNAIIYLIHNAVVTIEDLQKPEVYKEVLLSLISRYSIADGPEKAQLKSIYKSLVTRGGQETPIPIDEAVIKAIMDPSALDIAQDLAQAISLVKDFRWKKPEELLVDAVLQCPDIDLLSKMDKVGRELELAREAHLIEMSAMEIEMSAIESLLSLMSYLTTDLSVAMLGRMARSGTRELVKVVATLVDNLKDRIKEAIVNNFEILFTPPFEYAVTKNAQIEGLDPIKWLTQNYSTDAGKNALRECEKEPLRTQVLSKLVQLGVPQASEVFGKIANQPVSQQSSRSWFRGLANIFKSAPKAPESVSDGFNEVVSKVIGALFEAPNIRMLSAMENEGNALRSETSRDKPGFQIFVEALVAAKPEKFQQQKFTPSDAQKAILETTEELRATSKFTERSTAAPGNMERGV